MKSCTSMASKAVFFLVALLTVEHAVGQANVANEIDEYITGLQSSYNVPGVALAVVERGRVVHQQYYGRANLDFSVPVDSQTLFPIFSTTKIFVTVAVHELIEANRLRLDDKISKYVESLPASWRNIQVQHLLAHTSGLPDIVTVPTDSETEAQAEVYRQSLRFSAGQRFEYNQTNYWLLRRICERVVGQPLSKQVIETQFNADKKSVLFEGNHAKIVKNQATVYDDHERLGYLKESPYRVRDYLYGASGLSLTLDAFLAWEEKFAAGSFLAGERKALFQKCFPYVEKASFTYGFKIYSRGDENSYGMTGSAASAYRRFPERDLTIILLANGMFLPEGEMGGIDEVVDGIAQHFQSGTDQ